MGLGKRKEREGKEKRRKREGQSRVKRGGGGRCAVGIFNYSGSGPMSAISHTNVAPRDSTFRRYKIHADIRGRLFSMCCLRREACCMF